MNCDDSNACTAENCDSILGCANAPVSCDDSNNCTTDACNTFSGCTHTPLPAPSVPSSITVTGGSGNICPGDTRTYSVTLVAGVNYSWTPPTGGNITSGQGSNIINVTYDNNFMVSGTMRVTAGNACGTSIARSIVISRNTPYTPGLISGQALLVCANTSQNYSVTNVAGITYSWTPPAGANVISGQGTNSVSVDFGSGFISGSLSVVAVNVCTTSAARTLAISSIPTMPGGISVAGGSGSVCPGDNRTYSVSNVAGVTYSWTPPAGGNITGGQGTNTINITYDNSFTASGILRVAASNACGSSAARTLNIYRNTPSFPGVISGPASLVCANTAQTYSVPNVSGITYSWTAPAAASFSNGQGTNSVTVSFGSGFISGILRVAATNGCGSSSARSLTISSIPSVPGSISTAGGNSRVCPGDSRTYSVTLVAGVTYSWTPPTGGNITGGQGTNSINVTYDNNFTTTGTLSVTANNICGASAARSLNILRNTPSTPGLISGQALAVCANTIQAYSVANVSGITYSWTAPAGASISSGQGSNSVAVTFGSGFTSGTLSVNASNSCSTSSARNLTITSVPSPPGAITGPGYNNCNASSAYSISPVIGATSYLWNTTIAGAIVTVNPSPNDNTVHIAFPPFTSGTVKVSAVNTCGIGPSRSLTVYGVTAASASITGSNNPCTGSVQTYSAATIAGATSYFWTVPAGSVIQSGQGSTSVEVQIGSTSGAIVVRGVNACGNGALKSLGFVATGCPGKAGDEGLNNAEEKEPVIRAYPNPFSEKLNIEFSLAEDSRVKLEIFSVTGQRLAVLFEGDAKALELQQFEFNPASACDCMFIYRLQTEQGAYYGKAVMVR